jgi:RimJ/RimL family protein N-acetyltransferase
VPSGAPVPFMNRTKRNPAQRDGVMPEELPFHLRFGDRTTIVRMLEDSDTSRLIAFFASHTEETIHQRYGYALVQMTPEHARRLVNVDQSRDVALGVFEDDGMNTPLIAIGRYCLSQNGEAGEAAFVVREDCRGRGICTFLLQTLINFAQARGVPRLVALVQHDNAAMLTVFRRAGAKVESVNGTSEFEILIDLRHSRVCTTPPPPRTRARTAFAWIRRSGRQARWQLQALALRIPPNLPTP